MIAQDGVGFISVLLKLYRINLSYCCLIRDKEKGRAFSEKFEAVQLLIHWMSYERESGFVVLAIKRGYVTDYSSKLFEKTYRFLRKLHLEKVRKIFRNYMEGLRKISAKDSGGWTVFSAAVICIRYGWKHSFWLKVIGRILIFLRFMDIMISMIRWMLWNKGYSCTIYGKRYEFSVTETYGREGMAFWWDIFI